MKKITKMSLLVVMALLLAGCSATRVEEKSGTGKSGAGKAGTAEQTQAVKPANEERKVINFKLNDLNGKVHSLSDYRGKKVYIEYWASWCPVCIKGIGEFETLVRSYEKSSVSSFCRWSLPERSVKSLRLILPAGLQIAATTFRYYSTKAG